VMVGALASVFAGSGVVIVLLVCGFVELFYRRVFPQLLSLSIAHFALLVGALEAGALRRGIDNSLMWVAFKVGALSYGGGFVIIPMMFNDAVHQFAWMTESQFLDAVVLGQITPGPVVHTVAVVGFAAGGVMGALLTACVAFVPSFVMIGFGARHFERFRKNASVRSFLDGAGPSAIGAILGVSVPLLMSLPETWQLSLATLSTALVLFMRQSPLRVLLGMALLGVVGVEMGWSLSV
jgi:chromate transporter